MPATRGYPGPPPAAPPGPPSEGADPAPSRDAQIDRLGASYARAAGDQLAMHNGGSVRAFRLHLCHSV